MENKLLDGISVISQIPIIETTYDIYLSILAILLICSLFTYICLYLFKDDNKTRLCGILFIAGFIFAIPYSILYELTSVDEIVGYNYLVKLDEDISYTDITKIYNVIDYDESHDLYLITPHK